MLPTAEVAFGKNNHLSPWSLCHHTFPILTAPQDLEKSANWVQLREAAQENSHQRLGARAGVQGYAGSRAHGPHLGALHHRWSGSEISQASRVFKHTHMRTELFGELSKNDQD